MAERKKRIGRPTKPGTAGQRNSLGLRVTAEIKRKIEAGALKSGRSQSQEAEFLIEQALLKEEDYGGRELHGLLLLMVGAAKIIQARTGKSWSSDFETSIAVRAAWKKLAAAAGPRPSAELIQSLEQGDALPPPPELPTRPSPPRRGLLTPELMEKLRKLNAIDSVEAKEYVAEVAAIEAWRDHFISYQVLGKDVAAELFPRREAVIQTAIPAQRVEKTKEK